MKAGNVVRRFATVLGFGLLSVSCLAGEIAYERVRFNAALEREGGFVVAIVADWCMTCSKQKTVVGDLLNEPRFQDLTLFVADFDREFDLRRRLRVVRQGTFVVFKDGREVARATGQTEREAIAALFAKAL